MSQLPSSPSGSGETQGFSRAIRPLSTGNIVSAGVGLYRSHLKPYLRLSLRAHVWSLVPVYGWAKYYTLSAAIARHSFHEMIGQPESLSEAERQIHPHLWLFFVIQILVGLILVGINIALSVVQFLCITLPLSFLVGSLGEGFATILLVLQPIINIIFYIVYLWFWSRLFVPELPLAIDARTDIVDDIGHSWQLTSGSARRIIVAISVVVLIMLPLYLLAVIPALILMAVSFPFMISVAEESVNVGMFLALFSLALLVGIILFLVANTLVMPLWQTTKAVIYYDLKSRREGFGLRLRDRSV